MIVSDRKILTKGSRVATRIMEIGSLVEELSIILLSDKKHGLVDAKISESIFVYPTNSLSRFFRPYDAISIGKIIETDLITTQDPFECGWVGIRLKKFKRVPLEVQLHTDLFSSRFSGPLNQIRKLIASFVIPRADIVRVVTESLATKIRDKGLNSNVYVLPIYIDKKIDEIATLKDSHTKYKWKNVLLCVSRLSEEKNLDVALKSLSLIREKFPDTGLVIVGDGPQEKHLKNLSVILNIDKNIVFEGWQENLQDYYKAASIFLQPSNFEGYGLSIIEAGLSGVPVVSTAVGVVPDLHSVLISLPTPDKFKEAIESLLIDENKMRQLGLDLKSEVEKKIVEKNSYLDILSRNWAKTISLGK